MEDPHRSLIVRLAETVRVYGPLGWTAFGGTAANILLCRRASTPPLRVASSCSQGRAGFCAAREVGVSRGLCGPLHARECAPLTCFLAGEPLVDTTRRHCSSMTPLSLPSLRSPYLFCTLDMRQRSFPLCSSRQLFAADLSAPSAHVDSDLAVHPELSSCSEPASSFSGFPRFCRLWFMLFSPYAQLSCPTSLLLAAAR